MSDDEGDDAKCQWCRLARVLSKQIREGKHRKDKFES